MDEQWRPVVGFEKRYAISDLGRVQNVQTKRILRPGRMPSGHMSVALGRGNSRCVHSLVLEAFRGPRPPGNDGRHKDGVPHNNRLDNLVWGTRGENIQDNKWQGKHRKLTVEDIRLAKWLIDEGFNCNWISKQFGVRHQTIYNIAQGKAHADV